MEVDLLFLDYKVQLCYEHTAASGFIVIKITHSILFYYFGLFIIFFLFFDCFQATLMPATVNILYMHFLGDFDVTV